MSAKNWKGLELVKWRHFEKNFYLKSFVCPNYISMWKIKKIEQ